MQQRPPSLLGAAAVQAADAVIVLVASALAGADTIAGRSYQVGSGIALTLIGLGTAAALAWVAVGLSRASRWSRTPAAMTQLFVGIVGVYLVQGHRYAWGIPALVLACAGLILILVPASLRALNSPRPGRDAGPQPPAPSRTGPAQPGPAQPGPAKPGPAQPGPAQRASAKRGSAPPKPGPAGKRPARG